MSFRARIDELLAALVVLRDAQSVRWAPLQEIAQALGWDNPVDVLEVARFLHNQGYIRADFRLGGAVAASLTPAGDMYLNDKGAAVETLIASASKKLEAFRKINPAVSFAVEGGQPPTLEVERSLAFERIGSLKNRLGELSPPELVSEYLLDLQILDLELRKRDPDRTVLDSKLQSLSRLSLALGTQVHELVELLKA